jgi:gluconate 2-dehydrogenase gamma chain
MSREPNPRMARRSVVRLIVAVAAVPLIDACAASNTDRGHGPLPQAAGPRGARPRGPAGTLTDPDLVHPVVPWKLTLGEAERETLRALCDLILPGEAHMPAASALGAHDFVDEWISAPYATMREDAVLVREGLAWIDAEAQRRFHARFHALRAEQQGAIADTICDLTRAPAGQERAALFFDRVRQLTVIAVTTTREGMADLGYVGNVALDEWKAPPPEVLRIAGLL